MRRIWRWPIRNALRAYEDRLRREAATHYYRERVLYSLIAPYAKDPNPQPPAIPEILT